MPGHRRAATDRLAFARERLAGFAGDGSPAEREKRWKALASRLAAAVPELRAHGLPSAVISWTAGSGEGPRLAGWCCLWFAASATTKRLVPPAPADRHECMKWLLEREAAELRFLEREAEALVEQLKNLAKGYALAEQDAKPKVVA